MDDETDRTIQNQFPVWVLKSVKSDSVTKWMCAFCQSLISGFEKDPEVSDVIVEYSERTQAQLTSFIPYT